MNTPKTSKVVLCIGFVDTSYWDEGNRSAWEEKQFASLEAVNDFIAQNLGRTYLFKGSNGEVHSAIDPDRLQIVETVTTFRDWRSMPALKTTAETVFREEMADILKFGGDLARLELEAKEYVGWNRERFLTEWRTAQTNMLVPNDLG